MGITITLPLKWSGKPAWFQCFQAAGARFRGTPAFSHETGPEWCRGEKRTATGQLVQHRQTLNLNVPTALASD